MAIDNRKRRIISYERMTDDVMELFNEAFPDGVNENDIKRYTKPDGTPFYAVTFETPDTVFMIKIQVKIDDPDSIERWLQGEEDSENEQVTGASSDAGASDGTLPDDNIAEYDQAEGSD